MKKLIFCLAAISAIAASAMPTKKEVTAAREVVAELMSDVVADQKAGKLTAAQVAEKALDLAGRAETEAAKLLLIQGAVMGFARGGEPARAAEAMQRMKAEIKDITPEYEADVLARAVKTVPAKSGSRLYSMLDDAKRLVRFRKDVPVIEKKLAKTDTPELRMQLAERLAALGEWKRALEMFAKMDGDIARAAKFERGELTAMTASEVADIWWAQKGVKDSAGYSIFQRHAGEWYRKALADGSLKGLKRDLAQKRIDGMGGGDSAARSASAPYQRDATGGPRSGAANDGDTGGPRPVAANEGTPMPAPQFGKRPDNLVFKLDSKTDLEMVGIPAGKFTMGYEDWERAYYVSELCKPHEVTISRPFWVARFPVTGGMMKALRFEGEWLQKCPQVYRMIPSKDQPRLAARIEEREVNEFFLLLNKRFKNRPKGYVFRPPTMAEWEYYFKADGTDRTLLSHHDPYRLRDYILSESAKNYLQKIGLEPKGHRVGEWRIGAVPVDLFKPNPWGLQNVLLRWGTWLLDTVDPKNIVTPPPKYRQSDNVFAVKGVTLPEMDPVFTATGKDGERLSRGNMFYLVNMGTYGWGTSVRIVLGPDLIAEQAKKK